MNDSIHHEHTRLALSMSLRQHAWPPQSIFFQTAIFSVLLLNVFGCNRRLESEAGSAPEIKNRAIGKWTNAYEGVAGLAGVRVQQFPDCDGDSKQYEGRHPCMVIYIFTDGRANQMGFNPDGSIKENFWHTLRPDNWIWQSMDRSYASPTPHNKLP
jgi:hypothetical protein